MKKYELRFSAVSKINVLCSHAKSFQGYLGCHFYFSNGCRLTYIFFIQNYDFNVVPHYFSVYDVFVFIM